MNGAALEHNLANIANEENLAVAIRAQGHPACTPGPAVAQRDVESRPGDVGSSRGRGGERR